MINNSIISCLSKYNNKYKPNILLLGYKLSATPYGYFLGNFYLINFSVIFCVIMKTFLTVTPIILRLKLVLITMPKSKNHRKPIQLNFSIVSKNFLERQVRSSVEKLDVKIKHWKLK